MGHHPAADGELLYGLVEKQCTLEAIQGLLREYKALSKDIRVTAENKHEVIARNLRRAVSQGTIPVVRVFDLIRDSEENGAQHIFFYVPRNARMRERYADADTIASRLWGQNWGASKQFPRLFDAAPEEPQWCDFRAVEGGWVAKMYSRAIRYETIGEEEEIGVDPADGATIYQRKYKRKIERTVLLMRLNKLGILEVRVPTWPSRRTVEAMRELILKRSADAVHRADFQPWSLSGCATRMIREFGQHQGVYDLSDTLVRDSGEGSVTFSTLDERETLFGVVERQRALEVLLKPENNHCERLIVNFLAQKQTDVMPVHLRVVIGAHETNEIVIGASTTPAAVDYVIHRLRDFE